jgi:hypothetical protein
MLGIHQCRSPSLHPGLISEGWSGAEAFLLTKDEICWEDVKRTLPGEAFTG